MQTKKKSLSPGAICTIITIVTIIGAFLALASKSPLVMLIFLLPATIYEVIRTEEGASTKFSSIFLLVIIVLEMILILFNVNYDLAKFFGESEKYVAGYSLPLGDIKIFGPILTAILSVVLIFRTYGPYTKWLSVIIAIGSLATVYLLNPLFFQDALRLIVNGLFNEFSF